MRAGIIAASWSLFAILMALQSHYQRQIVGRPMTWSHIFRAEFAYAGLWALATPLVGWAARFPLDHRRWYRMAPVHVLLCLLVVTAQLTTYVLVVPPVDPQWQIHNLAGLVRNVLLMLDYGVMLYAMLVLIHCAVDYYARYQKGRVRSSHLELRLAQAQLQALKMQLHPHFLFNTLHSISTLVIEDPEAAEAMIARLSELLRLSLENTGAQHVSLQTELEFLERFLEIEQIRFEDRLHVRFDIDPQMLDAKVPNLILQPLVENAIRHGIATAGRGTVEIRATRLNGKLLLQVLDDGSGLQGAVPGKSAGLGLSNTRARLEAIYGKEHDFVLRDASNGGVEAAILIPMQPPQLFLAHDRNGENQDVHRRR